MSTTEKTKTQSRKRRRSTSPACTKSKAAKAEAAKVMADHQKMISYMLKAEDPIWGDLEDDDKEYNKFFKTTKTNKNTIKKRKVSNYKSTSPSISPTPSPIQSFIVNADIIRNVICQIGLNDITNIDNISIVYSGDNQIAHLFAYIDHPIGFYIINDTQLLETLSHEEKVFVKFLEKELMKVDTTDTSVKLNTLVYPQAVILKKNMSMAVARAEQFLKLGFTDAAQKAFADAAKIKVQFEEYIATHSEKRTTYQTIFLKDLIGKVLIA
jgi:hypothetical protein